MFVIPKTAKSWVEVDPSSHFSIQNLPFGILAPEGREVTLATAIGEHVVDIAMLRQHGLIDADEFPFLDSFADLTSDELSNLRRTLFELFEVSNGALRDNDILRQAAMVPIANARLLLPIKPSCFVDFYSGINHASNVGRMFRPDMPPLLPNYRHIPVAYNGRANSVVVSGTPIRRPSGQTKPADADAPVFGPTKELDFELELGFYVGMPSAIGEPVEIGNIPEHILGFVLVNDWSARDMQRWEYQPLGPFLAKSFGTSISPWIVLPDALEPFRINRLEQDPAVLSYLKTSEPMAYDIKLEVQLKTPSMAVYQAISGTNAKNLYWSFDQQLAHQSSNGTPLGWGDLYGSGTISGDEPGSYGSLLELTWRGRDKIAIGDETRTFLEDGDSVILTGYCQGDGFRVGFGSVEGTILPA